MTVTCDERRGHAPAPSEGAGTRSLRTDSGTIILHWLIVALFVMVAATGLRIASDEPALRWLVNFDSVLPVENVWYWHVIAGLGFGAVFFAYAAYMFVARLGQRIRIDRNRWMSLLRQGRTRWRSIGVLVIWIGAAAFAIEIVTGLLVYAGQAGLTLRLHRDALWVCLALPVVHVLAHYSYGGAGQLFRIFRPTRLVSPPPKPDILALLAEHVRLVEDMKRGREPRSELSADFSVDARKNHPLIAATIAGLAVIGLGVTFESLSGDRLFIPAIDGLSGGNLPVIDGDLSDPVWASAPPVDVLTDQGANFDGSGTSKIEVRAVHDGERVYFAFTWDDPTRSLKHFPLIKTADGWRMGKTEAVPAKEEQYAEDKFSVLLSRPTYPVVGAAIHLSPKPLSRYPASASGRGLHYTAPGTFTDVWVWGADHGGWAGYLDDAQFTAPKEPTESQVSGAEPYTGGFGLDRGDDCYADNVQTLADGSRAPRWVPRDLTATTAEMGEVHESPEVSDDTGSKWWIDVSETQPFTGVSDQRIPVGTIIPSVVAICTPSGDRADVRGTAQWAAGRWTLEVVRRLDTQSDQDIEIATGVQMWLAAFDHSATRHTRHLRPITLELL
jgi:hypothetical protein